MFGFLAPLLGAIGGKATLGKIAVGAVTGAINRSNAKRDLSEQRSYDRDTLLRVREDAERAGFNPLTALRNGASNIGSNTYLNSPALSSADFIGQALMDGIDTGFNAPHRELDAETQRLQNELLKAQIGDLQANTRHLSSFGFGVPAVETLGVTQTSMDMPPLARPTAATQERIPVYLPDGQERMVPKSWADRLAIQAFGQLGTGDYEELVGSGRAEVEAAVVVDQIGDNMGVPLFGSRPALSNDDNPLNTGPNWFNYWK